MSDRPNRNAVALARGRDWRGDPIDRETAAWADQLAHDLCRWCETRRDRIRPKADQIARAVEPYLGLANAMDTCERLTGVPLH